MNLLIEEVLLKNFTIYILPACLSLLAVIIASLLNKVRNKIKAKNCFFALHLFDDIVTMIVRSLNQTKVREIKKIQKRKINKNDIENFKEEAKKRINECVTKKIKNEVKFAIKNYNLYIENAIENKVKELKMKSEKR